MWVNKPFVRHSKEQGPFYTSELDVSFVFHSYKSNTVTTETNPHHSLVLQLSAFETGCSYLRAVAGATFWHVITPVTLDSLLISSPCSHNWTFLIKANTSTNSLLLHSVRMLYTDTVNQELNLAFFFPHWSALSNVKKKKTKLEEKIFPLYSHREISGFVKDQVFSSSFLARCFFPLFNHGLTFILIGFITYLNWSFFSHINLYLYDWMKKAKMSQFPRSLDVCFNTAAWIRLINLCFGKLCTLMVCLNLRLRA